MTMQTGRPFYGQRFTGKHMTAILVAGFAVVLAVNVTMATLAGTTFGGVVVENSYVASQDFNRWLEEAAKEKALGWKLQARRGAEGRVVVDLEVAPSILRSFDKLRTQDERKGAGSLPLNPARAELVEAPAAHTKLTAIARHPLGRLPDTVLTFRREGARWISIDPLPAGRWTLRFEVETQGRRWRTEQEIGA